MFSGDSSTSACHSCSPADQIGDERKDGHQHSGGGEHHLCSVRRLRHYRDTEQQSVQRSTQLRDEENGFGWLSGLWTLWVGDVCVWPTRCILGLVDGDGGAGQGQAARVLQGDVDAVGAGLHKRSPEMNLTLGGRRHVIAHDVTHLSAAGVRHDGAGWGGGAEDEGRRVSFRAW